MMLVSRRPRRRRLGRGHRSLVAVGAGEVVVRGDDDGVGAGQAVPRCGGLAAEDARGPGGASTRAHGMLTSATRSIRAGVPTVIRVGAGSSGN